MGFPGSSDGKASACNVGDLGSIPGSGRSPGEGNGNPLQYSCNPLQYSCLENSMDGAPLWAIVHGVAKSWTRLSDFTFTFFPLAIMAQDERHPKRERKGQRKRNRLENDLGCPSPAHSQDLVSPLLNTHSLAQVFRELSWVGHFLAFLPDPFLVLVLPSLIPNPQLCTKRLNE